MSRKKEFDRQIALQSAMKLFWQNGYTATSINDLENVLGIGRRSLYNTFGSKRALFLEALDCYHGQDSNTHMFPSDRPASAFLAIQQLFDRLIEEAVTDELALGCFMVNSALELLPQDAVVAAKAKASVAGIADSFQQLISWAKAEGSITVSIDDDALAHMLTNTLLGIRVMAKVNPDPLILRAIVGSTLSQLN